jgi:hypothetical protein
MADVEDQTGTSAFRTRLLIVRWVPTALWWLAIFAVVFTSDVDDDVLFAMMIMVLPALFLAAFLVAVPLWILFRLLVALYRRRWRTAGICLAVFGLAFVIGNAGQFAGDQWLIRVNGAGLEQAVADAKAGRTPDKRIMATPAAAYVEYHPDFQTVYGIAYDTTGRLADMLALPIEDRPREWLETMPQAFSCWGAARPLGGNYYWTNLDRYACSRD